MMRYFLFSALLLAFSACSNYFRDMVPIASDQHCVEKLRPGTPETTTWYQASVHVVGKHISGLMLIKTMADSSVRVVFTNQSGFKFFDFEFLPDGRFSVKHVISQLDRQPVIKTLEQDFALLLGLPFHGKTGAWRRDDERYFGVTSRKEGVYMVTDANCRTLIRLERSSNRKRMVSIMFDADGAVITHHTFRMETVLKKMNGYAE